MDKASGLDRRRGSTGTGWTALAALLVTGSGVAASPVFRFGAERESPELGQPHQSLLSSDLAYSRGPSRQTIRIDLATSPRFAAPGQAAELLPSRPVSANRVVPLLPLAAPVIDAQIIPVEQPTLQPVGFKLTQGASYALLASAVALPSPQAFEPASTMAADKGVTYRVTSREEVANAPFASAVLTGTPSLTAPPNEAGLVGLPEQGASIYRYGAHGIEFEVEAVVNGAPAGKVPLLIADSENISVCLADILKAIQPLMDPLAYDSLSASKSAGEYVTFNTLRASGVMVSFGSNDQLILGSD